MAFMSPSIPVYGGKYSSRAHGRHGECGERGEHGERGERDCLGLGEGAGLFNPTIIKRELARQSEKWGFIQRGNSIGRACTFPKVLFIGPQWFPY